MKAYRLVAYNQPLEGVELPVREPRRGEVLVRVRAAGLCHSDLPVMAGIRPAPLPITLGHEGAGTVVRTGPGVPGLATGDRVSIFYLLACDRCETCRRGLQNACPNRRSIGLHEDGAFAEFVTVPAANIVRLPDGVPFDVGAVAGCAASTAFHAVRVAAIRPGDTVAVVGLGGVGLHVTQLAKLNRAALIIGIDPNPSKERLARSAGVDVFVQSDMQEPVAEVLQATGGAGVDAAFECVGKPATYQITPELVKAGGRACMIGVCADPVLIRPFPLLLKEVRILFAVNHTLEEQRCVLELAGQDSLALAGLITHRLPLARLQEGFDLLRAGRGETGKVVVLTEGT